jgi:capsular exopolysaccharide synthesis family protein
MSRIHEALKKAEQERAAQANPSQAAPAPNAFTEMPGAPMVDEIRPPGSVASSVTEIPLTAGMPSLSGGFNLDTLFSRCNQEAWTPDLTTMLFMNGNDNATGTEEFRTLRSRLYHVREKMPLKKVLITSAMPKEGKSFTASNLAQVLVRQHGRRVLLIDADLRNPRLHLMLGTSSSPGLADYLQGTSDEIAIMRRGPIENFFFIPCGQENTDPSELIASERLRYLLQRVEPLFDWIIVDSPPAVLVSDASVLAKVCDGVLMVVRSNTTPADVAQRARQEFPEESLIGVVLNGTKAEMPYARYYYENDGNQSKT